MFVTPLQNALMFTITTLFNIYISIVLIRFLLQSVRADFYNPLSQFVYKATNPVIMPLRKIIPKFRNIEISVLLVALILQALELAVIFYIRGFSIPMTPIAVGGLFLRGAGELLDLIFVIYLFATFVLVILSWIQPRQYNPAVILIAQIVDPIFRRVGRYVPSVGMLDFTPMVVIFILILCRMLVSEPIMTFGNTLIARG